MLRLVARQLYDPYWSGRILDELARNLPARGLTPTQTAYRIDRMRRSFPAAAVSDIAVARLESRMTNEPKDRHVLAAAVASGADAVVTFNLRHFGAAACDLHDVEVLHPDRFLMDLHDLEPRMVEDEIVSQAAALRRPPVSPADLVGMLERAGVPQFTGRLRHSFAWTDG